MLFHISIGLYQYFPTKEAIVATLTEQHTNQMVALVDAKLRNLFDAFITVALPELIKAAIAAYAVNPKLHKVLDEQVPRIGRWQQVANAEEQIHTMLRAYLERWSHSIQPQNLDLNARCRNRMPRTTLRWTTRTRN